MKFKVLLALIALQLVVGLGAVIVFAQAQLASSGVDVLLIEHTDNGTIERTGRANRWTYVADSGGAHAVLCVDHTPDGDLVMRDGFDQVIPSCQ